MLPSGTECLLGCSVLVGDVPACKNRSIYRLAVDEKMAVGYAEDKLEIYNEMLMGMEIFLFLAKHRLAVSYLVIRGARAQLLAEIVAFDKTVIVIWLDFEAGPSSYLIYDAGVRSLRMIPAPEDPSWSCIISSSVSVARPSRGRDYALVHTGQLVASGEDSVFLWRPSSSSSPWSEYKKAGLRDIIGWSETNTQFSFKGHSYWADLLCGVFCFNCDALFDDDKSSSSSSMLNFIPLPLQPRFLDHHSAQPEAFRTMGIVNSSFIRFVSIDGFEDYVQLKDRTMTVWKLLGQDKGWEEEYKLSLETLWGFEGFGDVPKELTPMYPLLSSKDPDLVYLGLGDYRETKTILSVLPLEIEMEFFPYYPRYMLALDMRNKIVRDSLPLGPQDWVPRLASCFFSLDLRQALVGPF